MIVSHIIGGLGNQMFQYAAALALATAKGVPLNLDISAFEDYRLHNGFELSRVFSGTFEFANEQQIERMLGWRGYRPVRKVLKRPQMSLFRSNCFVVEPHFHYWPEFFELTDDCYLVGYWQSERYFKSIEDKIRRDFTFKAELSGMNKDLAGLIAQCNAVSLHIRRGDYANNAKTNATHGTLPLSYYQKSISLIAAKVATPNFFIFSDDINWAKENLEIPFPCQFIGHNQGLASYIDMQLMSLCKHHIIANSSFSWWGAWLNSSSDKIVVAPQKWFANGNSVVDLFPSGWMHL